MMSVPDYTDSRLESLPTRIFSITECLVACYGDVRPLQPQRLPLLFRCVVDARERKPLHDQKRHDKLSPHPLAVP